MNRYVLEEGDNARLGYTVEERHQRAEDQEDGTVGIGKGAKEHGGKGGTVGEGG